MKLKPFSEDQTIVVEESAVEVISPNAGGLSELLSLSGLTAKEGADKVTNIRKALNENGADIDNIAKSVGSMMRGAETDGGKLKACEMALRLHGIIKEMDGEEREEAGIVINIQGDNNQTLVNLVCPR